MTTGNVDCSVLVDDILQFIDAEMEKHPELRGEDEKNQLEMGEMKAYIGSEPEDDDSDDGEDSKEPAPEFKKEWFTGESAQSERNLPANKGARKKFFCTTCDAPFDFRIKRSKDPTNGKWYCAWCWRKFREKMYELSPENTEWSTCNRCTLGAFAGGGRIMADGKFFCNLCWKGWMGSLPQKSDWLPLTPEEKEAREKAREAARVEEEARLKRISEEEAKAVNAEGGNPAETLVQPDLVKSDVTPVAV